MNIFSSIGSRRISITNHAIQRFYQRNRLRLSTSDSYVIRKILLNEFKSANRDPYVHAVPFRESVNKSKHGPNSEVWRNGTFSFFLSVFPEHIVIKSIVRNDNR